MIPDHPHLTALEGDLGEFVHVEKVLAAQMDVALRLARPNRRRVDRHLDRGQAWRFRIELQRAMHVLESTTNVRHHHVPRPELGSAMSWLECPLRHPSLRLFGATGASMPRGTAAAGVAGAARSDHRTRGCRGNSF